MRAALFISRVWGSHHGGCAYAQALIDQLLQLRWRVYVLAERFDQPVPDAVQLHGFFQCRPSAWLAKLRDFMQIFAFTTEIGHRLIVVQGDLPRLSYLFLQELAPVIFIRQDAILTCPGNDRFLHRSHSVCTRRFGLSCLAIHRREHCFGDLSFPRQLARILLRLRDRFLLQCLRHFVVNSQYLAQAHHRPAHVLYPPLLIGPGDSKRCDTSALQNLRDFSSPASFAAAPQSTQTSVAPQGLGVRHDRAALDSPDLPPNPSHPYHALLKTALDSSHPRPSDGSGAAGEGGESSPGRNLHRLIFCARLEPVKGADDALRILSLLPEPYRLDILGEGPQRPELERRVRELNLDARVTFHGWVDPPARDRWFRSASLLLMPSLWDEAFGMAGLEAFAQSTPVVAYHVGGIPEWCTVGAGILVVSGDAEGAARAVRRLTIDPQVWTTYSAAAKRVADRDFPPTRFGRDLNHLLETLTADGR